MRFSRWMMVGALALVGCEQDIQIADNVKVDGTFFPPDLANPVKHDVIVQVTTPEVDILWVIDDSCSMSEEQQKLARNFPSFIEFFLGSGLDYHIGTISTDTDAPGKRGKLQGAASYRFIDSDTPNPVAIFEQMATLGTNGSIDERGRRAAEMALTDPVLNGHNVNFYRENASLNVIVISDENDSSASNPTRNEFINFLQTLKEDPELVTFSSIVGPQGGCSTAEAGTEYLAVTNAVGGIQYSICEADWAPVLEQLGLQAAGLRREYFLSEVPVVSSIDVWVVDGDFTYKGVERTIVEASPDGLSDPSVCDSVCFIYDYNPQRNSVIMEEFVPSPLAEINIRYELLSGFQGGDDFGGTDTDTDTDN